MMKTVIPKLSSPSKQPFTVFIEGNIGAGKTTFLNHFRKYDDVCLHAEPVEKWRNVKGINLLVSCLYDIYLLCNLMENPSCIARNTHECVWQFWRERIMYGYTQLSNIRDHDCDPTMLTLNDTIFRVFIFLCTILLLAAKRRNRVIDLWHIYYYVFISFSIFE